MPSSLLSVQRAVFSSTNSCMPLSLLLRKELPSTLVSFTCSTKPGQECGTSLNPSAASLTEPHYPGL